MLQYIVFVKSRLPHLTRSHCSAWRNLAPSLPLQSSSRSPGPGHVHPALHLKARRQVEVSAITKTNIVTFECPDSIGRYSFARLHGFHMHPLSTIACWRSGFLTKIGILPPPCAEIFQFCKTLLTLLCFDECGAVQRCKIWGKYAITLLNIAILYYLQ